MWTLLTNRNNEESVKSWKMSVSLTITCLKSSTMSKYIQTTSANCIPVIRIHRFIAQDSKISNLSHSHVKKIVQLTLWRPLGFGDFRKKCLNACGFAQEFLRSRML